MENKFRYFSRVIFIFIIIMKMNKNNETVEILKIEKLLRQNFSVITNWSSCETSRDGNSEWSIVHRIAFSAIIVLHFLIWFHVLKMSIEIVTKRRDKSSSFTNVEFYIPIFVCLAICFIRCTTNGNIIPWEESTFAKAYALIAMYLHYNISCVIYIYFSQWEIVVDQMNIGSICMCFHDIYVYIFFLLSPITNLSLFPSIMFMKFTAVLQSSVEK